MIARILVLLCISMAAACAGRPASAGDSAARYVQPAEPHSILVVTDRVANPKFAPLHAGQVANALRHFTPEVRWVFIDQLTPALAAGSDALVYLGDNGLSAITPNALNALRNAKVLVLTRFHVHQLHDAGIAFAHLLEGPDERAPGTLSASYRGITVPVFQSDFVQVTTRPPAEVLATLEAGGQRIPYIVRDGNATFINGTIDYDHLEARPRAFGNAIVISDALGDALHANPIETRHVAMLRLEDVSVQTQALRLKEYAEYLDAEHVAYGIGVIPDQLIKGQPLSTLNEDPELVQVLGYAQTHGATIILHGLHHSFNSPEDFEFWDAVHKRPLPQDSAAWMDGRIAAGLNIEKNLGLNPRMWETPHYSASSTDYREVAKVFPAAWEQRDPNGWLPWVLQRDQFGSRLLPENLGYVANDGSTTVSDQLAIAKELLVCRGCIAAGFLHPATIPVSDLREYVSGMRALGYHFIDPGQFAQ